MLIPLRVEVPMTRPWTNYAVIALTVLLSISAFYDEETFLSLAGFGTSALLHAGWLHLVGNMLFLWVFGNAVNYKFGHIRYTALYALCAIAGDAAHYAFSSGLAVGASGAIMGVMGAFLVYFPRNDVRMLVAIPWLPPIIRTFTISSMWVIIFWVGWDALGVVRGATTRVALWAHLGGFAIGFLVAILCAATDWIKPEADEETLLQVLAQKRERQGRGHYRPR